MQAPSGKFDAAKRATAAAIDELRRRHVLRVIAGTEKASRVYPDRRTARSGERGDQGGGQARGRRAAAERRHRDRVPGWPPCRGIAGRAPGGAHPRHLAHRRQGRARDARQLRQEIALQRRANSPATAAASAPTGRSRSCARSRRRCWAPWTSSPNPADLADDFAAMMRTSMGKSIPDLTLRLWTPRGATRRVRQAGRADRRGPDAPPGRGGQPARRLPAGLLGRRGPRLPHPGRGRTRARPGGRSWPRG